MPSSPIVPRSVSVLAFCQLLLAALHPSAMAADVIAAGRMPGEFSVSDGGAAVYRLPIELTPGSNGHRPTLELVYSSHGGDGFLGRGWGLSGLHQITRIGQIRPSDGVLSGVSVDASDRFALDGRRLMAVSGDYGAPQSVYRPEIDDFTKVVSYGQAGSGPKSFSAWLRDGSRWDLGAIDDARLSHRWRPDAMRWAVNRVVDVHGNEYRISYLNDREKGLLLPERLDYTGRDGAGHYASVRFSYADMPYAKRVRYTAGSNEVLQKRLTMIRVFVGESLVRRYELTYRDLRSDRHSELVAVRQLNHGGVSHGGYQAYVPVSLAYENDRTLGFSTAGIAGMPVSKSLVFPFGRKLKEQWEEEMAFMHSQYERSMSAWPFRRYDDDENEEWWKLVMDSPNPRGHMPIGRVLADFDGDGFTDVLVWQKESGTKTLFLNNRSGGWVEKANPLVFHVDTHFVTKIENGVVSYRAFTGNSWPTCQMLAQDLDGDGAAELLFFNHWTGDQALHYRRSDGSFWRKINRFPAADIKGCPSVVFGDWNGDGKTDVLFSDPDDFGRTRLYTLSTDLESATRYGGALPSDGGTTLTLQAADINGDGIADLIRYHTKAIRSRLPITATAKRYRTVYIGNGTGGFTKIAPVEVDNRGTARYYVQDLNGDGNSDIVEYFPQHGRIWWLLSTGRTAGDIFDATEDTSLAAIVKTGSADTGSMQFADANGDGLIDVAFHRSDTGANAWLLNDGARGFAAVQNPIPREQLKRSAGQRCDFAVQANDGTAVDLNGDGLADALWMGEANRRYVNTGSHRLLRRIENERLVQEIAYRPLTDQAIHARSVARAFPLQSYVGPVQVVAAVRSSDGLGGLRGTTYRYRDATLALNGRGWLGFAGVTIRDAAADRETRRELAVDWWRPGQLLSEEVWAGSARIERTERQTAGVWLNDHRTVHPRLTRQIVTGYEPASGAAVTQEDATLAYDEHGNVTRRSATLLGGHASVETSTYANDTDRWRLGRRLSVVRERTNAGQAKLSTQTTYVWDAANRHVRQETSMPGSAALEAKTWYAYDAWGNLIDRAVVANGGGEGTATQTRRTTWAYDENGRFAVRETNALGHVTTRTWHQLLGTALTATDANGLATSFVYDPMGRERLRTEPGVGTTATTYEAGDGQTLLVVGTAPAGRPRSWVAYDVLNRPIERRTEGFDGGIALVATAYHARGTVAWVSEPYPAAGPVAPYRTRYAYDAVDRVVTETLPNNAVRRSAYGNAGANRVTTRTDALNRATVETVDPLGRTIAVVDAAGQTLSYTYDSFDRLTRTQAPGGVATTMLYDALGRRTRLDDPNAGRMTTAYNGFGEEVRRTDARNQATVYAYDLLGRRVSAVRPEGTDRWTWDTAANGVGRLAATAGAGGFTVAYRYDGKGRQDRTTEADAQGSYAITRTFDGQGRVATETYPSGYAVRYVYATSGHLAEVREQPGNALLWQCLSQTARGQILEDRSQDALTTTYAYDAAMGWMVRNRGGSIFDQQWTYDTLGNLTKREDRKTGAVETFAYDNLYRLVGSTVGSRTVTVAYDAVGNITNRSDVGAYAYATSGKPYAVSKAGGGTYAYDAAGNMTDAAGTAVSYTSSGQPSRLARSGLRIDFGFDADGTRKRQQVWKDGALVEEKRYVGALYERVKKGSAVEHVHYLRHAQGTFAIRRTGAVDQYRALHRDHLGSVLALSDGATMRERLSFCPWGQRRNATTWLPSTVAPAHTDRGYTGHEHLDEMDIIHMNGRTYLPGIGRFMQPDPLIQSPKHLQNHNRYSYVLNRPLNLTDPSGFSWVSDAADAIGRAVSAIGDAIGSAFGGGSRSSSGTSSGPAAGGGSGSGSSPAATAPTSTNATKSGSGLIDEAAGMTNTGVSVQGAGYGTGVKQYQNGALEAQVSGRVYGPVGVEVKAKVDGQVASGSAAATLGPAKAGVRGSMSADGTNTVGAFAEVGHRQQLGSGLGMEVKAGAGWDATTREGTFAGDTVNAYAKGSVTVGSRSYEVGVSASGDGPISNEIDRIRSNAGNSLGFQKARDAGIDLGRLHR